MAEPSNTRSGDTSRPRRLWWVTAGVLAVGVVAVLVFVIVSQRTFPTSITTTHAIPAPSAYSAENTYFFSDRSHHLYEWLYAVRGREVVVQKAEFPGYRDRTWYQTTIRSDEVMGRVKEWAVKPGDLAPPFEPHGPPRFRISLTPDPTLPRGEAWFGNGTPGVSDWFNSLKQEFACDELRVNILPEWVTNDPRVRSFFGYSKE